MRSRSDRWTQLAQNFDLIVIGGGITGAGILREAARLGLRGVLFEARDFAWGTSSRSSKLVHGGLRYLKNAQIKLTYESVRERERLMREGRGLVNPLGCVIANFQGDHTPDWLFGAGLVLYDILGLRWSHRHYSPRRMRDLCLQLEQHHLLGGFRYLDAQTDDARLVFRVLREAERHQALALNYAPVTQLVRNTAGYVCGVVVRDDAPEGQGRTVEVRAPLVISATGVWADELRAQIQGPPRLRKLRGSHLVFPLGKLPITRAVNFLHPADDRPVFAVPWDGVLLFGTTDVDHRESLHEEPHISAAEVEYLLAGLHYAFPTAGLTQADVQATFAGVRPVVDTGNPDPSKESREHVLWDEKGLLTVSGGKLTTFRLMARDALNKVKTRLPHPVNVTAKMRLLDAVPDALTELRDFPISAPMRWRLSGRYGADVSGLLHAAADDELLPISGSMALWAELRWAAREEAVVHLEDLLLRRVRLGLLVPDGGLPYLDRIRAIVQPELGWDAARWETEAAAYTQLWRTCYAPLR